MSTVLVYQCNKFLQKKKLAPAFTQRIERMLANSQELSLAHRQGYEVAVLQKQCHIFCRCLDSSYDFMKKKKMKNYNNNSK
jgi:hypothetical protein